MVQLNQQPPNNFRDVDIYPTQDEILGARNFLRKNIICGKFNTVEEYLDIQFRLLREDFTASLREGIESYRSKEKTKIIDIYKNVKIYKGRTKRNEECLKINVPVEEKDSKKFMNGSLLLFTKNDFIDLFQAKVIQKLQESSEIIIGLVNLPNNSINLSQSFTMAECSQYFDPYYNVLDALKNINPYNFPMEKYIVHVDTSSVYIPSYLNLNSKYQIDGQYFSVETLINFIGFLQNLNQAQMQAFIAALTREFVVIQGPPGTGKTHLGVKIASTIIRNHHLWWRNSPLLIISHKNDALDQFLEGLIPVTERLVRVGSQSKSQKLKRFNLYENNERNNYLSKMQKSLVVGMTTSIAARWRGYLEMLKSPIVIVEEAAEVLEAHVVAAFTDSCRHLILLGDHQQLQPLTADYTVSKNYHLGVSLFERMVRNGTQCYQLDVQHRMRPEISDLLKLRIYPFLKDHESVQNRPQILGMDKNLFFIDHENKEETCNITTKKNVHEAQFLVVLARYLIYNGHKPGGIAILATYAAQVNEIVGLMKGRDYFNDVKVSSLDGFQGQEADIVLLSLVRSDKIGFLADENRVCVALSRARNGFYIIGNMRLLASKQIWSNVRKHLEGQKSIGRKLSVKCQSHQNITRIEAVSDFGKLQNGGCGIKCDHLLFCGHVCCLMCHTDYMAHKCEMKCTKPVVTKGTIRQNVNLWSSPRSNGYREWLERSEYDARPKQPQESFVSAALTCVKNVIARVVQYVVESFFT